MGGTITIVQVKVTMTYPVKKGVKISFTPINEVTSFPVTIYLSKTHHRTYGQLFLSLQT